MSHLPLFNPPSNTASPSPHPTSPEPARPLPVPTCARPYSAWRRRSGGAPPAASSAPPPDLPRSTRMPVVCSRMSTSTEKFLLMAMICSRFVSVLLAHSYGIVKEHLHAAKGLPEFLLNLSPASACLPVGATPTETNPSCLCFSQSVPGCEHGGSRLGEGEEQGPEQCREQQQGRKLEPGPGQRQGQRRDRDRDKAHLSLSSNSRRGTAREAFLGRRL